MKHCLVVFTLILNLTWINSNASIILPPDTIIPSQHKFATKDVYVPKTFEASKLISLYFEHLKAGKRTIGFVHEDELAMIEEKKLTEKKMFFDSYEVTSIGKRMATIKVYTARGMSLSCKLITLRYYQNMNGHYLLIPGKIETFEKKMGDITLKEVFISTWTSEGACN